MGCGRPITETRDAVRDWQGSLEHPRAILEFEAGDHVENQECIAGFVGGGAMEVGIFLDSHGGIIGARLVADPRWGSYVGIRDLPTGSRPGHA